MDDDTMAKNHVVLAKGGHTLRDGVFVRKNVNRATFRLEAGGSLKKYLLEGSGLYRVTCINPGLKTALERVDLGISLGEKYVCRTGTTIFCRSGAVGDYPPIPGYFGQPTF